MINSQCVFEISPGNVQCAMNQNEQLVANRQLAGDGERNEKEEE